MIQSIQQLALSGLERGVAGTLLPITAQLNHGLMDRERPRQGKKLRALRHRAGPFKEPLDRSRAPQSSVEDRIEALIPQNRGAVLKRCSGVEWEQEEQRHPDTAHDGNQCGERGQLCACHERHLLWFLVTYRALRPRSLPTLSFLQLLLEAFDLLLQPLNALVEGIIARFEVFRTPPLPSPIAIPRGGRDGEHDIRG